VNTILKTNEITISNSVKAIKLIECNQLASNHPIEDRLRISRFSFKALGNSSELSDSIALAVFDGHGGGSCADVISRRLFHYIALSLIPNIKTFNKKELETLVQDLYYCPNPNHNITSLYDERAAHYLKEYLNESEQKALEKYVEDFEPTDDISTAIGKAFLRCDSDLSQEIEHNLLSSSSNILLHYYLSLAVSGCCVTLLLIHQNIAYIASTGNLV
jgi:pyruvate dehydrogenase phosphatase